MRRTLLAAAMMLAVAGGPVPAQPGPGVGTPAPDQAAPVFPAAGPPSPATLSDMPAATAGGTSTVLATPLPASRALVEPLPPSLARVEPLSGGELAAAGAAGTEVRVQDAVGTGAGIAPSGSDVRAVALAASRVVTDRLPASRATIEALAPASTQVERLRSELDARETERGTVVTLPGDVLFDFDKADIRRDARPTLAKLAELIGLTPGVRVLVEGHTDAKGSDTYNLELSRKRARSVADWLARQHGIERARLRQEGRGEAVPVAPNARPDGGDDPAGRQRNRRVEVVLERG